MAKLLHYCKIISLGRQMKSTAMIQISSCKLWTTILNTAIVFIFAKRRSFC